MASYKICNQIFVALIANFGAFLYGIALGYSTAASCEVMTEDCFNFKISNYYFAWIVAFMPLGAACSSLFCGILRKFMGTRLTVFFFGIPMIVGYVIIIFSVCPHYVMLGRFFVGISAGCYVFIPILYIGEIASNEIRGLLLSTFFFMVYCGVLFVYAIGHYTSLLTLHVISAMLPIFYSTAFVLLPESPPMLVSQNRIDEAKECILFLRGSCYNVEAEIDDLKIRHQAIAQRKKFLEVFSVRSTRKALFIIIGLFFFLQMSGITIVPFYSLVIFTEAGFQVHVRFITIIVAAMQAISCLFAVVTVDRFGRKILIIASTSVMGICFLGISIYFSLKELKFNVSNFMLLPLIFFGASVIAFSIGLAPVTYVLLGEIFLQEAKVYVAPISKVVNFLLAFLVSLTFPIFTDLIGFGATFFIYAILNFSGTIFTVLFVPDYDKWASLTEIQSIIGMHTFGQ